MSVDKRSTHTDALATLGTIIGPEEKRDAIHIAVEPVEAGERLFPGQSLVLEDGKAVAWRSYMEREPIGIVDPFLENSVGPGDRFWLLIMPRKITSLRHVWSHPLLPDEPNVAAPTRANDDTPAVTRLKRFAAEIDFSYDELIAAVKAYVNTGDYMSQGGRFAGVHFNLWDEFEEVTGCTVDDDLRGAVFSCSC